MIAVEIVDEDKNGNRSSRGAERGLEDEADELGLSWTKDDLWLFELQQARFIGLEDNRLLDIEWVRVRYAFAGTFLFGQFNFECSRHTWD